jgi:hypothetical protein
MDDSLYDGYERVSWRDVKDGDTVWIDNFEHGKFPKADPKISGPYIVESVERRILRTTWNVKFLGRGKGSPRSFMHYPNNLLRKES